MPPRSSILGLLLLLALPGCGDPPATPAAQPAADPILPPSIGAHYLGQEVWITFQKGERPEQRRVIVRDEAQARAIAENLRERVARREDFGRLALEHSAMPGSVADGFFVAPHDPKAPTEREQALMRVPEGGLTPVLRVGDGFWFARRLSVADAAPLQRLLEDARTTEARGQAIVIHHASAWPFRHDQKLTRAEAEARASLVLERLLRGEEFAALARESSSDVSGDAGGMLLEPDPATKQRTQPWIRLGSPWFPSVVVNHLMRSPVGEVVPRVLDTAWGFVIVKPLERRRIPE